MIKEVVKDNFEKVAEEVRAKVVAAIVAAQGSLTAKTLQKVVVKVLKKELALDEDGVKKQEKTVAKMIKDRVNFVGEHELSVKDLFKGYKLNKVISSLGTEFKKDELKHSAGFWYYFTNVLNMARQYDGNFVDSGLTPLKGISSLNAVLQGAYELSGLYTKGANGQRGTVNPNARIEDIHEGFGTTETFVAPISMDESTLWSQLEGAAVRVSKGGNVDTFVMGIGKDGKAYARTLRYIQLGKLSMPVTEHLIHGNAVEVTAAGVTLTGDKTGVTMVIAAINGETEGLVDGHRVTVELRFKISVKAEQSSTFTMGEVKGDVARTAIISADNKIKVVRTDATWDGLSSEVSVKSRKIITQDWITGNNVEEPHPLPMLGYGNLIRHVAINPNTATEEQLSFYLEITNTQAQAIIAYRNAHGNYTEVEQLRGVPTIDVPTYARL